MSVDPRIRRLGENEALFRKVNEQIEAMNKGVAELADGKMHIVCECADLACAKTIPIDLDEYERVRAHAPLFIVSVGHVVADLEDVVEEDSRYQIVRKRAGDPEAVARATDPRDLQAR